METEVRREQIAEAALDIVSEEGVGALTVRKVAKRVGFSAPALYRHYKSKADILMAALDDHFATLFSLLRDAMQSCSPLEILRVFYFSNADLLKNRKSIIQIFVSDQIRFGEPKVLKAIETHRNNLHEQLTALLKAGQEQGEIRRDIGIEELFVHYLGLIITPDLLHSHRKDYVDLDRQADANWKLFRSAVRV